MTEGAKNVYNIVICGTAGQGVITIKRLLEFVAAEAGFEHMFGSEMHGLAQREGAIMSHVRLQRKLDPDPRKNVQSPSICYGDADLYLGFEPVEVLRNGLFASGETTFVVNTYKIPPVLVNADLEEYPSDERIAEVLGMYGGEVVSLDATTLAVEEFGDAQKMNLVMVGAAMATGKMPDIPLEVYEKVIRRELRDAEKNIQALHRGLEKGRELLAGKP
ncbi:MAG: 2-oxoacid:acceptor oxidoreductase family protein [Promethearchaeota archaeon]